MRITTCQEDFKAYHVGVKFLNRTLALLNNRNLNYSYKMVTDQVVRFVFQHKASFVLAENGIIAICMGKSA